MRNRDKDREGVRVVTLESQDTTANELFGSYSVLLRVAVCCCLLQCVAVWCSVLQCVARCNCQRALGYCSVSQVVAVRHKLLQCVAAGCTTLHDATANTLVRCCSVLRYVAVCCSVLQCSAVCCGVLQDATDQKQTCMTGFIHGT